MTLFYFPLYYCHIWLFCTFIGGGTATGGSENGGTVTGNSGGSVGGGSYAGGGAVSTTQTYVTTKPVKECAATLLCSSTCKEHVLGSTSSSGCQSCSCPSSHHVSTSKKFSFHRKLHLPSIDNFKNTFWIYRKSLECMLSGILLH